MEDLITTTQSDPIGDLPDSEQPGLHPEEVFRYLDAIQRELDDLRHALSGQSGLIPVTGVRPRTGALAPSAERDGSRIIEGVFDGQNMVGPDGKQYSVPANYASKSKLVEGDVLKLTITRDGSFIYKQIGPIERQRIVGELLRDEMTGEFKVMGNGKAHRVLLASITYFKGEVGDDVVILVPKDGESRWAAVENIIKKAATTPELV